MSWADTDDAGDADSPAIGSFPLTGRFPKALPPIAVVFDDAPVNRAIARRLVTAGFPVAWFTRDDQNALERGERLRGTKARTPRHAAEIAAFLPRRASKAGGDDEGGSPRRVSGRASRRSLQSALDAPNSSTRTSNASRTSCSTRGSTNPFTGRTSSEAAVEETYDDPFADAYRDEHSNTGAFGARETNPLLVVFAVSGDAEMCSSLERLLAGEKASASSYVDRALLAGSVAIVTGPISEVCATQVRKRCFRAGVRLVQCAVRGDARAALNGALSLYIATSSKLALQACVCVFKALSTDDEIEIVSHDTRDAASARLAMAVRGAPRETAGAASLRATGASAAAVAAERRAIVLEKQLDSVRQAADESAENKKRAVRAEQAAHAADQRAVEAMERNAELRVEVDLASKEVNRLAAACASLDKHLHSGSDEKRNEIEQLRLKEIELRDEIRLRAAEAASAKSDAAALISNLTADVLELTLRIKRHEDATSRDADVSVANSKSAENRLRTALDEALGSQKNERAENDRLREKLERLESVRRDFDELSRRADSDVADAEDRADNATRRAEKAENALRRVDEKTNRSAHERDAARDAEAATKRELETVKSALTAAGATRDADAALAREFADREAALAVAAADVARADAESRARKAHDALTCANRRRDELESDNRRLVGELASVRDELKAHAGASHVVSRLELELAQTQDSFQSMEREKIRLERVVVEAHAERTAVVAAATATSEREAHRQRGVAQEATRARLEAEAASYRASKERDALSDTVRISETQMKAATIAEARARRELAAERVAGEAAHLALADIGLETSRLAGEIEDARESAARVEQQRRRAAEHAGAEASAVLRDALDEAESVASPGRDSDSIRKKTRPDSPRHRAGDEFAFDSSIRVDSPQTWFTP